MKKTIYFKQLCSYSNAIQVIDRLIVQKEDFLKNNSNIIAKIDSEDLRVDHIGQNQAVCILKISYYEK